MERRVVCRFSCGAASAVATKLALKKYGHDRVVITYSDTKSEHPDNARFLADCEKWFGKEIIVLRNDEFRDVWHVWEEHGWITNRGGSLCTGLLKREPTYEFTRPDDILVFGYTVEERHRAERFRKANFEVTLETPLIDAQLTKDECLGMLDAAGIAIPAMYLLGYVNNNCIGCPKGGMGYWNKIRVDFPETFERMAALQRKLGPASGFWNIKGQPGVRISLDELAPDRGNLLTEPNIECSLLCQMASADLEEAEVEGEIHSPSGRSAPSIESTPRIGLTSDGAREPNNETINLG
jgi:3'-phosphoadenosine 5'-phosphosulfate sulfotransferase (PAPS reductase)/FAD synthetase